jgi:hypothetical protein
MNNTRKCFLLSLAFFMFVVSGVAQNDVNSPYSSFGVGNVSPRTNNILSSMGGAGYALQNPYYINFKNPAAFAAFDSLSFIADLSFSVINQQLKVEGQSQSGTFAQLDYLAIGLPILKMWRMSAGIMPYSDVGYGILDTREPDSISYQYKGTGGLQLLYWGNAFKVCKGLTVGMNLSYLFGTINTMSITEYNIDNVLNTMINSFRYLDGIYISGGVQYHANVKEKHNLSLGVVYENALKVWSRENLIVLSYFGEYFPNMSFDTVRHEVGKDALKSTVKIPQIVGAGISYGYKDRLLAAVDITWQNWKKFSMSNTKDSLQNNWTTAIGIQYVPNPSSSKYHNKINFRVGTRFSTGYFVVKNSPITEFAVSFGLGFPIRTFTSRSSVNVMFEYSRFGTIKNNLILQNYFKLSFNFILQEKWYQRRKLE